MIAINVAPVVADMLTQGAPLFRTHALVARFTALFVTSALLAFTALLPVTGFAALTPGRLARAGPMPPLRRFSSLLLFGTLVVDAVPAAGRPRLRRRRRQGLREHKATCGNQAGATFHGVWITAACQES